jgi:hypothetical protein
MQMWAYGLESDGARHGQMMEFCQRGDESYKSINALNFLNICSNKTLCRGHSFPTNAVTLTKLPGLTSYFTFKC